MSKKRSDEGAEPFTVATEPFERAEDGETVALAACAALDDYARHLRSDALLAYWDVLVWESQKRELLARRPTCEANPAQPKGGAQ